jgi:hypothetical protein
MRTFARPKVDDDDPPVVVSETMELAVQIWQFKIGDGMVDLDCRHLDKITS